MHSSHNVFKITHLDKRGVPKYLKESRLYSNEKFPNVIIKDEKNSRKSKVSKALSIL